MREGQAKVIESMPLVSGSEEPLWRLGCHSTVDSDLICVDVHLNDTMGQRRDIFIYTKSCHFTDIHIFRLMWCVILATNLHASIDATSQYLVCYKYLLAYLIVERKR